MPLSGGVVAVNVARTTVAPSPLMRVDCAMPCSSWPHSKRKIQSVAGKYRRQIKEFLAQQEPAASRPVYTGPDPATNTKDIRELLEFAIDNESAVALQYLRATNEEIVETVKPESLNGDKLFAFCEQRESYRAYRLKRIRSAGLNGLE